MSYLKLLLSCLVTIQVLPLQAMGPGRRMLFRSLPKKSTFFASNRLGSFRFPLAQQPTFHFGQKPGVSRVHTQNSSWRDGGRQRFENNKFNSQEVLQSGFGVNMILLLLGVTVGGSLAKQSYDNYNDEKTEQRRQEWAEKLFHDVIEKDFCLFAQYYNEHGYDRNRSDYYSEDLLFNINKFMNYVELSSDFPFSSTQKALTYFFDTCFERIIAHDNGLLFLTAMAQFHNKEGKHFSHLHTVYREQFVKHVSLILEKDKEGHISRFMINRVDYGDKVSFLRELAVKNAKSLIKLIPMISDQSMYALFNIRQTTNTDSIENLFDLVCKTKNSDVTKMFTLKIVDFFSNGNFYVSRPQDKNEHVEEIVQKGLGSLQNTFDFDDSMKGVVTYYFLKNPNAFLEKRLGSALFKYFLKTDKPVADKIFESAKPYLIKKVQEGELTRDSALLHFVLAVVRAAPYDFDHYFDSAHFDSKTIDFLSHVSALYAVEQSGSDALCQTERHLVRYLHSIVGEQFITDYLRNNVDAERLRNADRDFLQKAFELEKEGYYTFVHGQRFYYLFIERWFTALKEGKLDGDFLYAHVKDLENNSTGSGDLRKRIVEKGWGFYQDDDFYRHVLFLNYALFANSQHPGCNSTRYVLQNKNEGEIFITLEEAFKYNDLQDVYNKYELELKLLEKEFNTLTSYGNKLLVAVPKDSIHDVLYAARPGGRKKEVAINGKETDDIRIIMDALQNNNKSILSDDADDIEFCLAMTPDEKGGLNPESGIKIIPFFGADEQKLADIKRREQALFKKIKADIESKKTQN